MTTWTHNPSLLSLSNGTALSNGATTDSAAGWVLTCNISAGTGTVTFQDGEWLHTGNPGVARLDGSITVASGGGMGISYLCKMPSWPTSVANRLIELRHASNFGLRLEQNTTGTIVLLNAANTAVWTSSSAITANTEVRLQVTVDPATSTTGVVGVKIYTTNPRSSTTPDMSYSSSAFDAGTTDLSIIRLGRISSTVGSTGTVRTIWAIAQDSTADIAPLAGPPTLAYTSAVKQVVDARTSASGSGAALTYAMAYVSGEDNSSGITEPIEGLFLVPQGTSSSIYSVTVTEITGTDTDNVTVPAAGAGASGGLRRRVWDTGTSAWV